MVASRKFLTWSGLFIVSVAALSFSIVEWSFPVDRTDTVTKLIGLGLGLPCALIALGVTVDAVGNILESRRYAWLWAIVLLAVVGAYLYGFVVASRASNADAA